MGNEQRPLVSHGLPYARPTLQGSPIWRLSKCSRRVLLGFEAWRETRVCWSSGNTGL